MAEINGYLFPDDDATTGYFILDAYSIYEYSSLANVPTSVLDTILTKTIDVWTIINNKSAGKYVHGTTAGIAKVSFFMLTEGYTNQLGIYCAIPEIVNGHECFCEYVTTGTMKVSKTYNGYKFYKIGTHYYNNMYYQPLYREYSEPYHIVQRSSRGPMEERPVEEWNTGATTISEYVTKTHYSWENYGVGGSDVSVWKSGTSFADLNEHYGVAQVQIVCDTDSRFLLDAPYGLAHAYVPFIPDFKTIGTTQSLIEFRDENQPLDLIWTSTDSKNATMDFSQMVMTIEGLNSNIKIVDYDKNTMGDITPPTIDDETYGFEILKNYQDIIIPEASLMRSAVPITFNLYSDYESYSLRWNGKTGVGPSGESVRRGVDYTDDYAIVRLSDAVLAKLASNYTVVNQNLKLYLINDYISETGQENIGVPARFIYTFNMTVDFKADTTKAPTLTSGEFHKYDNRTSYHNFLLCGSKANSTGDYLTAELWVNATYLPAKAHIYLGDMLLDVTTVTNGYNKFTYGPFASIPNYEGVASAFKVFISDNKSLKSQDYEDFAIYYGSTQDEPIEGSALISYLYNYPSVTIINASKSNSSNNISVGIVADAFNPSISGTIATLTLAVQENGGTERTWKTVDLTTLPHENYYDCAVNVSYGNLIIAYITDLIGNISSVNKYVSGEFKTFEAQSGGNGMGLGARSSYNQLNVGWDTNFEKSVNIYGDLTVQGSVNLPDVSVDSANVTHSGSIPAWNVRDAIEYLYSLYSDLKAQHSVYDAYEERIAQLEYEIVSIYDALSGGSTVILGDTVWCENRLIPLGKDSNGNKVGLLTMLFKDTRDDDSYNTNALYSATKSSNSGRYMTADIDISKLCPESEGNDGYVYEIIAINEVQTNTVELSDSRLSAADLTDDYSITLKDSDTFTFSYGNGSIGTFYIHTVGGKLVCKVIYT